MKWVLGGVGLYLFLLAAGSVTLAFVAPRVWWMPLMLGVWAPLLGAGSVLPWVQLPWIADQLGRSKQLRNDGGEQ